jgi:uncharacterized membrane protein YedE/YeeE
MFEVSAATQVFIATLAIAVVFGIVAARSHFCVMGAVSDWVNMGDRCRLRSWLLAMATATLGFTLLEWAGLIDTREMRIDYRSAQFAWTRFLIGGLLFGIGMTLASGCSSKNLVRLGGGNLKSLIVLFAVAALALAMMRGDLYGLLFHGWMRHLPGYHRHFNIGSRVYLSSRLHGARQRPDREGATLFNGARE